MSRFTDLPGTAPIPTPRPATLIPPGGASGGYGHNMTLAALMERQKTLAAQQDALVQSGGGGTVMGGLGMLANTFVDALQERRAAKAEAEGRTEVGDAFKTMDPNTGMLSPDALQTIMRRDPDTGMDLYKTAMALRATQAKTDQWTQIPTPEGENGQWYQNQNGETKKVGGGADTGAWKPSDIAARADDYTKAAATYDTAAPSWQSMQDAAKTAIGGTGANVGSADLNLVVGLAKILDPNSVVREGESESVKKTGGAADYLVSYYNQLVQGGTLTDDIRRGIMNTGQSRMKAYYDQAKAKRDWISGVAKRHQVDPNDVVPPLAEFTPFSEAPPADPNKPADPNTPPVEPYPAKPAGYTKPWPTPEAWLILSPEARTFYLEAAAAGGARQ